MISVSIVDDEKKLCQSIATFLNDSPGFHCVSIYGSAEAALRRLPADRDRMCATPKGPGTEDTDRHAHCL
jgi:DNA-binding NarL/FixJ family response regulator